MAFLHRTLGWEARTRKSCGLLNVSLCVSIVLSLISAAYWMHSIFFYKLTYRLNSDEIYFAHTFWLLRQGLDQYYDFYSIHLPAYFLLLSPLTNGQNPADLDFVWSLRMTGIPVIAAYVFMLWCLERKYFLSLLPILLSIIMLARMTEIRTDTLGLVLVAASWSLLLGLKSDWRIVAAAVVSSFALLFSARAAVIVPLVFVCCGMLAIYKRKENYFLYLALIPLGWALIAAIAYFSFHESFVRMLKFVYLDTSFDPTISMPRVFLKERLLTPERLFLLSFTALAAGAALAAMVRSPRVDQASIIAIACLGQIALILLDPAPFEYVYGWSLIPTLVGIGLLGDLPGRDVRLHVALLAALSIPGLWLMAAAFPRVLGTRAYHESRFHKIRLKHDHPIADVVQLTTQQLLTVMVRRQEGAHCMTISR